MGLFSLEKDDKAKCTLCGRIYSLSVNATTGGTPTNQLRLPKLSKLAARFLSAPPSSVESERLFSVGGQIYTPRRNRLAAETGKKLMFLNFNLKWLKGNSKI